MEMLVRRAMKPLPALSTANWMRVSPVQKLEQLCMFLVMAKAAKAPVAVLFSTAGVADYVRSLLSTFEEQQYFMFGNLMGISSGMTWQQVRGLGCLRADQRCAGRVVLAVAILTRRWLSAESWGGGKI